MLEIVCQTIDAYDSSDFTKVPNAQPLFLYLLQETNEIQKLLNESEVGQAKRQLKQLKRIISGKPDLPDDIANQFQNSINPITWRLVNELTAQVELSKEEQTELINQILGNYKLDHTQVRKSPESFKEQIEQTWDYLLELSQSAKNIKLPSIDKDNLKQKAKVVADTILAAPKMLQDIKIEPAKHIQQAKDFANKAKLSAQKIPEQFRNLKDKTVDAAKELAKDNHSLNDYLKLSGNAIKNVAVNAWQKSKQLADEHRPYWPSPVALNNIENLVNAEELSAQAEQMRQQAVNNIEQSRNDLEELSNDFDLQSQIEHEKEICSQDCCFKTNTC